MTPFEKWSVWITTALTTASGIGYFWTKYLLNTADPWAAVNHPLEPWFLKLHVIAAPLLVFAVGAITLRHVWRHFRSGIRWGRRSGIITAAVVGPMVLTGYLIQVITGEGWLRALAIAHIAFGLGYVCVLLLHQMLVGKRPKRGAAGSSQRQRGEAQLTATPPVRSGAPVAAVGPAAPEAAAKGPTNLLDQPSRPS